MTRFGDQLTTFRANLPFSTYYVYYFLITRVFQTKKMLYALVIGNGGKRWNDVTSRHYRWPPFHNWNLL